LEVRIELNKFSIASSFLELSITLGSIKDDISFESHRLYHIRIKSREEGRRKDRKEEERERQTCNSACDMFNRNFLFFTNGEDNGIHRMIVAKDPKLRKKERE
jgi:hypothetical protein